MPIPPRIFSDVPLAADSHIALPDAAARHVVQVLRMRSGETLILFDGHGGEYPATLVDVGRRSATVSIGAAAPVSRESPLALTLLQGVSKGERMDYTVQKAAELGVMRVVPVITEYCNVRIDGERWSKKLEHWRAVAVSACEQSGRTRIPEIAPVVAFEDLLSAPDAGCSLVLDPDAARGIGDAPPAGRYRLLVGPEGGLSESEVRRCIDAGFVGVRMGPRILRTETAGVVAATVLQLKYGDLA